jgi:hypothetical protein
VSTLMLGILEMRPDSHYQRLRDFPILPTTLFVSLSNFVIELWLRFEVPVDHSVPEDLPPSTARTGPTRHGGMADGR